jgi:hypothetical protein
MINNIKVTTLLRKSLLSIQVTPFGEEPLFKICDWNVFNAGAVQVIPPEDRARNKNYQIQRGENEKILVRIFLSTNKKIIEKTKIYFLRSNSDEELTLYISLALLAKLPYEISANHELLPFAF